MENNKTKPDTSVLQKQKTHTLLGDILILLAAIAVIILVVSVIVAIIKKIIEVLALAVAAFIVLLILPFIRIHFWF